MMVRTSKQIKDNICLAIKRSYYDAHQTVTEKVPQLNIIKDFIYDVYIAPYQNVLATLPGCFTFKSRTLSIVVEAAPAGRWRTDVHYSMEFFVPQSFLLLQWDELPEDFRETHTKATNVVNELNKKQAELLTHFEELFGKCATVQQLVKAWPAVEMFLPEAIKNQMAAPEVRGRKKGSKKEEVVAHENMDALVALPILIKEP
jgi:hypothetical protein